MFTGNDTPFDRRRDEDYSDFDFAAAMQAVRERARVRETLIGQGDLLNEDDLHDAIARLREWAR